MSLLKNARNLRKNSTPMEMKIWQTLRSRRFESLKFRRQCPLGIYIEIDGSQHNEPEIKNTMKTELLISIK